MQSLFEDNDVARIIGQQEKVTRNIIDRLGQDYDTEDPILQGMCMSLLSLAQNIDAQNRAGKEISRNMSQYIDALWKIREMYSMDDEEVDEDVEKAWNGTDDE